MAEYSQGPYYEQGAEAGHYGGPENYQGLRNEGKNQYYAGVKNYGGTVNNRGAGIYEEVDNYEGVENYRGDPNYRGSTSGGTGSVEAYLKRKRDRFENTRLNFELWDNEANWRPFTILPRSWWRALPPNTSGKLQHPVDMVILTYTMARSCPDTFQCSREVKRLQNNHKRNGAVDIVFNFLIGGNGQVFEGRGWHSIPRLHYKLQRYSRNSLHIGLLGTSTKSVVPSDKMLESAQYLMEFGVKKQFISPKFLEYSTKLWMLPRVPTESEVLKAVREY